MANLQYENTFSSLLYPISEVNKRGWTNNVFRVDRKNEVLYYLPAYLRLKFKNITSIDLQTLTGEVNCTFILSIFYSSMQEQAVDYLYKSIEIAFNKTDAIDLGQDNLEVTRKNDEEKKLLTFTLRKIIASTLDGNIFWSPFETVKFIISLSLRSLKTQINSKRYIFKFNLMDCDDMDTKFSLSQETDFGFFRIAEKQLEVQYANTFKYFDEHQRKMKKVDKKIRQQTNQTNFDISKKASKEKLVMDEELQPLQMKKNVNTFRYAHFVLSVYKKPGSAVLNIFFPLLLLGIINIGIFYQDNTRTGKMEQNIAALLVSFIALIPTVRQNTVASSTVTFTEILVFMESSTTILALIHMIIYRNYDLFQVDMQSDGLLIASVVITCLVAVSILGLIILHFCVWKRQYHFQSNEPKQLKFNREQWYNLNCDRYFETQMPKIKGYLMELKKEQQHQIKVNPKQISMTGDKIFMT